jgi:hypothetical protein
MNPRTMWDGGMEAQTEDKPNQRADILRMVNSGKTSAAEAARLFGFYRLRNRPSS